MTTTSPVQATQLGAGIWNIDPNHSLIEFAAKHFDIAYVKGRFRSFSGQITVDEQDLLKSRVELTIDAGSVDSQAVQMREDLIRGEEMLEASKYPTITFRSSKIEQQGATDFLVTGDLTLRGVTKQVQIPMQFGGLVSTRMGPKAGFSGALTLNKSDFDVPFNREFEPGRFVVGEQIKIELQVEAAPAAPPSA
jgi:polyisoprenoid-binding protein YceI